MHLAEVSEDLTDPNAPAWTSVPTTEVALEPVPIDAQPTEYVRIKWADLPYGTVDTVTVAAARSGGQERIRLEWADDTVPNTEFPDAAAVYFPTDAGPDAPARTIGAEGSPVSMVYWRSNAEGAKQLVCTGPGRFRPAGADPVGAAAALTDGRWSLVLDCPAGALETGRVGVVVWNGSNEERAGLGATSDWLPIETA